MKLTVQVEPESLEAARQRAARKIAKKTKIPGFRPGKAPFNVIVRTVGEAAIFEEAVELLASDLYPKAIEEAGIEPYGPGQFENIPSMDPLTLEFLVPLEAEITLRDYHSLRFPYDPPAIKDEDVTKVLNDLRDRQAIVTQVDRAAMVSDQVMIKLSANLINPDDRSFSPLIEERSTSVTIHAATVESSNEWPYPGFSNQLIGLSAGDEKTTRYSYPEDSDWQSLRGKEAQFNIKVETVNSRDLPEADDSFAKSIGEYENIDNLVKEIRASLEDQAKKEYDDNFDQQILSRMVDDATIKYPPQMLEQEIKLYIDQLVSRLAQQGMELETYLKTRQMDNKALEDEVRPLAEQRLKQTLVLFKVARLEKITVSNEEIETESTQALAQISKHMTPDQAKKAINDGYIRSLVGNISTDLLIRRTYERLRSITKGEFFEDETISKSATDEQSEVVESPIKALDDAESPEQQDTPEGA